MTKFTTIFVACAVFIAGFILLDVRVDTQASAVSKNYSIEQRRAMTQYMSSVAVLANCSKLHRGKPNTFFKTADDAENVLVAHMRSDDVTQTDKRKFYRKYIKIVRMGTNGALFRFDKDGKRTITHVHTFEACTALEQNMPAYPDMTIEQDI